MSKELEEFKKDLELQEKRVHEKIDPILKLRDKLTEKELVDKLSEAFYELEKEYLSENHDNM